MRGARKHSGLNNCLEPARTDTLKPSMPRVYGYVRPYPGRLGKQVRDFVEEQGFVLGPGMVVAAGATDVYASRWILRATMDLLVLPFHLHRGDGGQILDAIGVLMSLPGDVDLGGLPVLMPVRAFSWGSSFQRRLELLKDSRPLIARQLIIAHQDEIGSPALASRLRRAHARPPSKAPLVRSRSMLPGLGSATPSIAPPTVRQPAGQWQDLEENASASWRIDRVPSSHPASSRPSGTRPTIRPEGPAEIDWSESILEESSALRERGAREPFVSEPAVSGERERRGHAKEEERASLILPRLPKEGGAEPDSATERFRRAAEIGAKTRLDAAGKKKT